MLLEQAVTAREAVERQVEAALASAGRLVQAGKTEDAIQLLKMLPAVAARAPRVQMAIAGLEDDLKISLYRMAGRAYALLGTEPRSDLAAGHGMMQRVAVASAECPASAAVAVAYDARQKATADQVLTETARKAETLLRNHDRAAAEALVHGTEEIVALASPQGKANWQAYVSRMNKKGLMGRMRG